MCLCAVSGPQCQLPAPLRIRSRWRSLDSALSLHLDSGNTSFSFLKSGTLLEQVLGDDVTCDNVISVSIPGQLPLCHHYPGGKHSDGRSCQVRMVNIILMCFCQLNMLYFDFHSKPRICSSSSLLRQNQHSLSEFLLSLNLVILKRKYKNLIFLE